MNKGKVVDIQNKYVVVMNDEMAYEKIEKKKGLSLGKEIYYFEEDRYKESKQPVKKYFLVAAVLFMMLFIQPLLVAEEAYGYISVDINPSVELQVNRTLEVLSIEAVNEDAKGYTKEEWIGKPAKEVIDLIIKETKNKGILNTERNFVLVSYYFEDEDKTSEEVFIQSLDELFNEKPHDYEVAVIRSDAETYTEAKEANESLGRQVVNKKMNSKVEDLLAAKASIEADEDFKIYKDNEDKDKDEDEISNEKALEDNPGRKNEKNPIFGDRDDVPGQNKKSVDLDEDIDNDISDEENDDRDEEDDDDQDFRQTRKMITPPEAKSIALSLVKGRIIEVDLDRDKSEAEYEIDIILDGNIHELIIDGFTGQVTSHEVDESDDWNDNEGNKGNNKGSDKDDEADNDADDKEKDTPNNNGKSAINRKVAEAIAFETIGGKGEILEFDFERDDSTAEYTIEVQLNGKVHEMKIDGFTGDLLDHNIEVLEKNDDIETIENFEDADEPLKDIISQKDAEKIALDRFNGHVKVTDNDFDEDEVKYIFEVRWDNKSYEIKINGFTGEIHEYKITDQDQDESNGDEEKNTHGKNDDKIESTLLREEIESIALDYINGEITSLIIKEADEEVLEYQVIIETEEYIHELLINGITGEIIEHEKDLIEKTDDELKDEEDDEEDDEDEGIENTEDNED